MLPIRLRLDVVVMVSVPVWVRWSISTNVCMCGMVYVAGSVILPGLEDLPQVLKTFGFGVLQ